MLGRRWGPQTACLCVQLVAGVWAQAVWPWPHLSAGHHSTGQLYRAVGGAEVEGVVGEEDRGQEPARASLAPHNPILPTLRSLPQPTSPPWRRPTPPTSPPTSSPLSQCKQSSLESWVPCGTGCQTTQKISLSGSWSPSSPG